LTGLSLFAKVPAQDEGSTKIAAATLPGMLLNLNSQRFAFLKNAAARIH
jgi:hypothetical protein